ncbi:MAG TPA: RNA methyltransferase [Deltaproteobacteria bacterium]|nr:RNA methyltransferase [Deltaproteobacteria bacterium]HOM29946.1 RNA methyltransferase [Deltaproteobacteria bacterium]HPP80753.1 RNA methyltransferase [Deltaproteobacteria bacterium]
MAVLTSRGNKVYKAICRLKRSRDVMVLEGRRLVQDALSRGLRPRTIAVSASFLGAHALPASPDAVFSDALFATLAETETSQGLLALFDVPWARMEEVLGQDRIVVLDGLQDPGNVGTVIRTAEAFGFRGVVILPNTASPFSPKAVRASMGSCLGVAVARGTHEEIVASSHRLVALTIDGDETPAPALFEGRFALCLGREASGLSPVLASRAHHRVRIPMAGPTESLNVAVAAGIVMAVAAGVVAGPG